VWDIAAAEKTLMAVMPPGARVHLRTDPKHPSDLIFSVASHHLRARLVRYANLAAAKVAVSAKPRPQVLVMSRTTPAIRDFLSKHSTGWVDQTGSAQISSEHLLISRDAVRALRPGDSPSRWTRSMLGVAEALLMGIPGTVSAVSASTGLAQSSAAAALHALTQMRLLTADDTRGRNAGRRIVERSVLLSAYSEATTTRPHRFTLRVGVLWRDPVTALSKLGESWTKEGTAWAATSALAAAVSAPLGTQISPLEIYLDAASPATMSAVLKRVGLEPLEGGRLWVAPFPSEVTRRLVNVASRLPVVPWPRAYADLQHAGVRGEDAAEHLREVMERESNRWVRTID